MSQSPLISAKGLCKQFGAVHAARDMTVDIHAQTITGLIGTNGAGKTTFVNMLTGYMKPDSGNIFFAGREITGLPPREVTRMGIARSFQIPQLFTSLNALENVEIALGVAKQSLSEASAILERFGLSAFAQSQAGTLPEGIRKLLDIALAMVAQPKVLLLDEPTSGVASDEKFEVMDRVMYDMEIVRRYSDRVLAFYDGTILANGTPDEVLAHEQVREYIIGEPVGRNKQEADHAA
jgi:branched-chain amino acid transport system ATP-binding protein